MSVDLTTPIAIYIAAENHGGTEALAECFVEDAIVRDEGQTIKNLVAIKRWKANAGSLRISFAQREAQRTADGN